RSRQAGPGEHLMATDFKLPNLGEGVEGGDVIDVLVAPGDQVEEGQPLIELETSKAAIAVPAPVAGRVTKLHVKKGDHAEVGQVLVTLEDRAPGGAADNAKPARAEPAQAARAEPAQAPPP